MGLTHSAFNNRFSNTDEIENSRFNPIPDYANSTIEGAIQNQQIKYEEPAMAAFKKVLSECSKNSEANNAMQSKQTAVEESRELESSETGTRPGRGCKRGPGFYYELGGAAPSGGSGMDYGKIELTH